MKTIINGMLYDTETAELIAVGTYVEVYRTKKGNWFKKVDSILGTGCQIVPIELREAGLLVGENAPENYCKYFGRAVSA